MSWYPQPETDLLNAEGGPAEGTGGVRFGFFTDTSVCIGCKACEVACKEWNQVPENPIGFTGNSMDNTGSLGANAWRHVAFIEQPGIQRTPVGLEWFGEDPGLPPGVHGADLPVQPQIPVFHGEQAPAEEQQFRWLMSSDVCKHCTSAACLEVCPTGAIFSTEFDTVVVQDDICNGCGYCVTACPYGVIERREADGGAWKCTLCYDRMRGGLQPACAKACPTDSIQFGPLDWLRERAKHRLDRVIAAGQPNAQLYGHDEGDGVKGNGAFFLLLDDPEVYRLPPDPVTPTRNIRTIWSAAAAAAVALTASVAAIVLGTGNGAGGGR
ncbi:MAG: 4Fe-4S dicluster domain-containing protein [Nitriliruptorales bacterium]|nr:4Fe-4S dicluster domain-containing protein [Nitriliruptorales bacterium]